LLHRKANLTLLLSSLPALIHHIRMYQLTGSAEGPISIAAVQSELNVRSRDILNRKMIFSVRSLIQEYGRSMVGALVVALLTFGFSPAGFANVGDHHAAGSAYEFSSSAAPQAHADSDSDNHQEHDHAQGCYSGSCHFFLSAPGNPKPMAFTVSELTAALVDDCVVTTHTPPHRPPRSLG